MQDLVDPALVLGAQRLELGDEIVDALAHGGIAHVERLRERLQVAAGQDQRLGEEQILGGQAQETREPELPAHMQLAVGARHLAYGEQSIADGAAQHQRTTSARDIANIERYGVKNSRKRILRAKS